MQPSTPKKYVTLQMLRALAAWIVVYHHYMQIYFNLQYDSVVGMFFSRHGALGVDVFFVISGFVIYLVAMNDRKGPLPFLTDRIFRLAPAYWLYSLVVLGCIVLFPLGFTNTGFTLQSLAASMVFLPSWNPSGIGFYPVLTVGWTLNFEMFFYMALVACMLVSPRHYLKLLFGFFLALPFVYPQGVFFSSVAGSFKLLEFLAGGCIAMIWTNPAALVALERHRAACASAALVALAAGIAMLLIYDSPLLVAPAVVVLALLGEPLIRQDSPLVRMMVRLGDQSYSTYLAHCIVIGIAFHFTGNQLGFIAQLGVICAITVAIHAVSRWSYLYIERNAMLDRARKQVGAALSPPLPTPVPVTPVNTVP